MVALLRSMATPVRRFGTIAVAAVLVASVAGSGSSRAASTTHTRQSIAQHILATRASQIMTANARLALEAMARAERPEAALRTDPRFAKGTTSSGGVQAPSSSFTNVRVNDPSLDTHQADQTTQSETTIAVSGANVVVGYNDSAQALQPFLTAGADLNGYAYSTNGGASFTDGGTIPNKQAFINLGDPWLAADRAGNVYYSSLAIDGFSGNLDVAVAKSTNGGHTFTEPVLASPPNALFYFGDKDALTVGRSASNASQDVLYDTWDDSACDAVSCFNGLPVARSTDGGATWQIAYADKFTFDDTTGCSFQQYIGAQPLVDPRNGTLYVAAERFSVVDPNCDGGTSTMDESIFVSTDGGQTFGPRTTIASVVPAFPNGFMQLGPGLIVRTIEFPTLALFGNALYAAWNDGASGDSHVRLAKSTNGGRNWTLSWASQGSNDEIQPALSADASALHLLYYQRDGDNTLDTVVANSSNGSGFVARTVTTHSFPGVITVPQFDPIIAFGYMGDYIANVSHSSHDYFAWGDNRDRVTDFMFPHGRNDPDVFFAKK